MSFKKPFDKPKRHSIEFKEKSRTFQEFKNECDINNILQKFQKQGIVEHLNKFKGDYSDYTEVQDYHTSYNQILAAEAAFNDLPSSVRKKFKNDPGEFLDFVGNPDNAQELIDMGLATPQVSVAASEAEQGVQTPVQETVQPEASQEVK